MLTDVLRMLEKWGGGRRVTWLLVEGHRENTKVSRTYQQASVLVNRSLTPIAAYIFRGMLVL